MLYYHLYAYSMRCIHFQNKPGLHYFAVPVVLICIFSYIIAHCFLSVYEVRNSQLSLCMFIKLIIRVLAKLIILILIRQNKFMKKKVFPWTHFYILERFPFLLLCIIFVSLNIVFYLYFMNKFSKYLHEFIDILKFLHFFYNDRDIYYFI